MNNTIKSKLEKLMGELESLSPKMYGEDFLLTWEKSDDAIKSTIIVAEILEILFENDLSTKFFERGLGVSIFRDNSTRTRFSFAFACNLLGLSLQDLDEGKSQIAHGETVRETANMISFLTDFIGIRDDKFLDAGNRYMREVGDALNEGHREGVLHRRPGIVNLQCDIDHPTQAMADLLHLKHIFGDLSKLKGKKIAMTWAYSPSYGKPLSVPQGIIGLMSRFGMDISLAHPEGYHLKSDVVEIAKKQSRESGGSFEIVSSMDDAFKNADIVYPKSWAPYSVMEERTKLLKANDHSGLDKLEKECLVKNANFIDWECNRKKMELTKDGNALYMHCLPADITGVSCEHGEVTAEVFEKYRIRTYKEAGQKPFIIASMMLLNRFPKIGETFRNLSNFPLK